MGFLDKAKALADQAVAKADEAMGSATGGGNPKAAEPFLRDLGVLAYLEATGRAPGDLAEQRARCVAGIQQVESQVTLNFALSSVPPPAPGAAAGAPPAPGASAPPPAPGAASPPPPAPGATPPPPAPGAPPAPAPAAPSAPIAPPPPPGSIAPPPPPGTV